MKHKHSLVGISILRVIRKNIGATAVLLVSVCGVVLASLAPPWLLKQIVDSNLMPKKTEGLMTLALSYVAAIAFAGLFDFLKAVILTVLGQKITFEIRAEMMCKLQKLPALYFSKNDSGSVTSRFMNDVDTINAMFSGGIVGMAVDCFKIVGIVVSIWMFSPRLGIMTLALLPVIAFVTRFFQNRMFGAQVDNRVQTAKLSGHLSESLKNFRMIKIFRKERFMQGRYRTMLDENFGTIGKINFYDSIFPPVVQLIRVTAIALVVVLSTKELHFLGITTGMIAASIELVSNLFSPIETLGMEFQSIQSAVSGVRRVNDFFREGEEADKTVSLRASDIIPDRSALEIRFNNLSFSYDEGVDVLTEIDLVVHPLEKVTFTGRTGAGKTTLFRLVMGLLEPVSGSVTINGVDVHIIPNAEKKHIFGYVDQNFFLVRGTIADQISLKDASIPREAIINAIETVGLGDYVEGLEKGIETEVEGDALFSQGQKQLLSIARAIVSDPPILLLDEMTASLDSITEEKIVTVLQKAGFERTLLAISHRPSSMLSSDAVVILENGCVRDIGSPAELLERDEWYRNYVSGERLAD